MGDEEDRRRRSRSRDQAEYVDLDGLPHHRGARLRRGCAAAALPERRSEIAKPDDGYDCDASDQAFFVQGNVGVVAQMQDVHAAITKEFGDVNGLVNNAGRNAYYDPVEMTETQWDDFMNVDFKSIWVTAKLCLPAMRKAKKGAIVNISSIHARMSYPNYFPYAAAKSGILGLTRNLALDEGKNGIRVNAVLPGFTLTPLIEDYFALNPEKRAEALSVQPMGRMAEPIEIAKVITFLLTDDASFVNGADWIIDGGLSGRFA